MRVIYAIAICGLLSSCKDSDKQDTGINTGGDADVIIEVRTWKVPANFMNYLIDGPPGHSEEAPFNHDSHNGSVVIDRPYIPLPSIFKYHYKIPFPHSTSTEFSPNRGLLVVKNTVERLDMIDKVIKSLGTMDEFTLDAQLFHPLGKLALNSGEWPSEMSKWQWHLSPVVMNRFRSFGLTEAHDSGPDPFREQDDAPNKSEISPAPEPSLKELLILSGISMTEDASASYDANAEVLTIVNVGDQILLAEKLFLDIAISITDKK